MHVNLEKVAGRAGRALRSRAWAPPGRRAFVFVRDKGPRRRRWRTRRPGPGDHSWARGAARTGKRSPEERSGSRRGAGAAGPGPARSVAPGEESQELARPWTRAGGRTEGRGPARSADRGRARCSSNGSCGPARRRAGRPGRAVSAFLTLATQRVFRRRRGDPRSARSGTPSRAGLRERPGGPERGTRDLRNVRGAAGPRWAGCARGGAWGLAGARNETSPRGVFNNSSAAPGAAATVFPG